MSDFLQVCLISLAVFSVSWTVTQEEIFKDFRQVLKDFACRRKNSWLCQKLAYLPTCVWCFSHWVAILAVIVSDSKLVTSTCTGYVFSILVMVVLANVYATVYHTSRVLLRWLQAKADLTSAYAKLAEMDIEDTKK